MITTSLGIKYSMRDLIYDINYLTAKRIHYHYGKVARWRRSLVIVVVVLDL